MFNGKEADHIKLIIIDIAFISIALNIKNK